MNRDHFLRHIAFLIVFFAQLTAAKDFIFDFGGVLIFTNKVFYFRHIGITTVASCSFQLGINPFQLQEYIKKQTFAILDKIAHLNNLHILPYQQAYDEKGQPLPIIMNRWLQGLMTTAEITALLDDALPTHPQWFKCRAEQHIISRTLNLIFTPELFVHSRVISAECVDFIKRCKKEGHRVYGLSNWDAESFALLKKKHAHIFNLFDGIIISAHVQANKPHASIYQALLADFQLEAKNCWFIDDQKENIEAAHALGINAIQHISTFPKLIKNIRLAHAKSLSLRKDLNSIGTKDSPIKSSSKAIIEGENISLTDSTKYSCLPAKA
jgi:FMN phosphatase YigB (HAD superfamily)